MNSVLCRIIVCSQELLINHECVEAFLMGNLKNRNIQVKIDIPNDWVWCDYFYDNNNYHNSYDRQL